MSIISRITGPRTIYIPTVAKRVPVTLKPLVSKATWRWPVALRSTTGYHGTSLGSVGEQLSSGQFKDRGGRIYFDSKEVAASYAMRKAASDGTAPLVLEVTSKQSPGTNKIDLEGWGFRQGAYSFFQTDKPVLIRKAFIVESQ